jgi:quercetin dioxygenase-like cupin family protein
VKVQTLVAAAHAAFAIATNSPAFAHDIGDKVTPNFEQSIANIPGKSLVAVVVDYPPNAASVPHTHARSALSTPTSFPEKFSRR